MTEKGFVPKEVLSALDINQVDEQPKDFEITAIVEKHQTKFPLPRELIDELNIVKSQRIKVKYDPKKRQVVYQI